MAHVIEGLNFKVLFDCNGGSRKRPVAAACGESCSSGPSTPTSSPPCYLRGGLPAAAEHCDLNAVRRTRENASEAKRNGTHLQKTHSAFMAEPHPKPRPVTKRGGRPTDPAAAAETRRCRKDEQAAAFCGLLFGAVSPRAAPEPGLESKDFIRKVQETPQRVGR